MMRAAIMSANSIRSLEYGSDRPSQGVGWNLKAMETQIFLVGYDRDTGLTREIHAIPAAQAGGVRSIAGLAADMAADWPLSQAIAGQIASLIGTEIDAGRLEYCLEPHQDAVPAGDPVNRAKAAADSK